MRNPPSIADVDFGRVDAESEDNLADYFVDTGVLAKLAEGKKQFIVGRKGSGKTALFRLTTADALKRDVIALDFLNYPWEAHKLVREGGLSQESAYQSSWRFTFLAAVCRHWAQNAKGDLQKTAKAKIKEIYQDEAPGLLEVLIDKFRRLRRIDLPEAEGLGKLGGVELDEASQGPVLARSISQWCRVLEDLVMNRFDEAPFTIKLDRLDEGWDATEDSKLLLVGILKAARDLNLKVRRKNAAPVILTFLRSDIFNELRFNDKNKMTADVELLEWPDDKLLDVASRRIAHSLNVPEKSAWDLVFSTELMRQSARISSYILKRTMGRPRDMIAFCLKCQDVARSNKHKTVTTQDVYTAEVHYSSHIYDELDDEMHKQLPESRSYLFALRTLGKTRFTLDEWIDVSRAADPTVTKDIAKSRLKVLFDYSVVGVPRSGGVTRGTTFQFNYHDRLVQPDFNTDIVVHPALKKQLQLKEPRAHSGPASRPEDDEDSADE